MISSDSADLDSRAFDEALDDAIEDVKETKKLLNESTSLRKTTDDSLRKAQEAAESLKKGR
jgi:hypothetical protein